MSLSAGLRLGHYEIVAAIGAGGMGEVYEARDTKLDREVAIKALPQGLAHDPERLARFGTRWLWKDRDVRERSRMSSSGSLPLLHSRGSAKAHLTNLDSEPRTSVSGSAVADIFSSASLISAFVSILLVPASGSSFRNHTRRGC